MRTQLISLGVVCVVISCGIACSDDDASNPAVNKDAGPDEGGSSGAGKGGTGATGGKGGSSGKGGTTMKPDAGDQGGSGGKGGSGGSGGSSEGDRCGVITCDARATCDRSGAEPKCVCPDGDEDTSGLGTKCVPPTTGCAEDCGDGYCIDGVCCENPCDDPPACQTAEGATCADGKTCVYANVDDGTECDDGDACTEKDACTEGACAGTALDCDDGNPCTADSCDQTDGCVNDGTDITTTGCAPDTLCASGFKCAGNKRGDCNPTDAVNCSAMTIGCNLGTCDEGTGDCVATVLEDGAVCNDGNECTTDDTCQSGNCTAGAPLVCDDGNACTDDSCDTQSGCVATIDATNACAVGGDGDPCTTGDHCDNTGACVGTPKSCPPSDQCHVGICNPSDGSCGQMNKDNGTACNDSKNCTKDEVCTNGVCADADSNSACLDGATGCTEVNTRTCSCGPDYAVDAATKTCVRDLCSEVNNPCDPNATCSVAQGASAATCTCKPGFDGNGMTGAALVCTDHDDCVGNPCGAGFGTCTDSPAPGTHTCSCIAGMTNVKGKCVCDLNGVWAMKTTTKVHWTGIDGIKDGDGSNPASPNYNASATSLGWTIRSQSYDANGNLTVSSIQCGGTSPTLCGDGMSGVKAEAYSQFNTSQMYGSLAAPGVRTDDASPYAILVPRPNGAFNEPEFATLSGVHLPNALTSTFPTSRSQIGASSASAINGVYWVDDDHDGKLGVTSFVVPNGGVSTSLFNVNGSPYVPVAQQTFTDPTPTNVCNPAVHYEYVPALCGFLQVCRVKATYGASRVISKLDGNFGATCNTITGDLSVTSSATEARVGGCILNNGSGTQRECTFTGPGENYASVINDLDKPVPADQLPQIDSSTFIIKKIANPTGLTCADVRAMTF